MKEMPKYDCINDGSRCGGLMFCMGANALSVNTGTYRCSERREDICFMTEGRGKLKHLMMECDAYERKRLEMMSNTG
jgi:hypothetical protein